MPAPPSLYFKWTSESYWHEQMLSFELLTVSYSVLCFSFAICLHLVFQGNWWCELWCQASIRSADLCWLFGWGDLDCWSLDWHILAAIFDCCLGRWLLRLALPCLERRSSCDATWTALKLNFWYCAGAEYSLVSTGWNAIVSRFSALTNRHSWYFHLTICFDLRATTYLSKSYYLSVEPCRAQSGETGSFGEYLSNTFKNQSLLRERGPTCTWWTTSELDWSFWCRWSADRRLWSKRLDSIIQPCNHYYSKNLQDFSLCSDCWL